MLPAISLIGRMVTVKRSPTVMSEQRILKTGSGCVANGVEIPAAHASLLKRIEYLSLRRKRSHQPCLSARERCCRL